MAFRQPAAYLEFLSYDGRPVRAFHKQAHNVAGGSYLQWHEAGHFPEVDAGAPAHQR